MWRPEQHTSPGQEGGNWEKRGTGAVPGFYEGGGVSQHVSLWLVRGMLHKKMLKMWIVK